MAQEQFPGCRKELQRAKHPDDGKGCGYCKKLVNKACFVEVKQMPAGCCPKGEALQRDGPRYHISVSRVCVANCLVDRF